jgi:hypothetical protein
VLTTIKQLEKIGILEQLENETGVSKQTTVDELYKILRGELTSEEKTTAVMNEAERSKAILRDCFMTKITAVGKQMT